MKIKHVVRLIPIASFGVVLGHIFVYKHLFSDVTHSHDPLAGTGHAYFGVATVLTSIVAVVSLATYGWMSFRDARRKHRDAALNYWSNFVLLGVMQTVLFVGMELIEYLSVHGSIDSATFFASSVVSLGIIFQIVTAAFVALLVTVVVKAGKIIARLCESEYAEGGRRTFRNIHKTGYDHLIPHLIRGPPLYCVL